MGNDKEREEITKRMLNDPSNYNNNSDNNYNQIRNKNELEKDKDKFQNSIDNSEKKINEEEMENKIRNFLKCSICLTKVTKPKMCKFCKNICCEACINNWLINHDYCTKCKHTITSEEMINLPFLDDMSKYFVYNIDSHPKMKDNNNQKELNKNKVEKKNDDDKNMNKIIEKEEEKKCKKHNNKLDFYCINCNEYYCSNCLVFFGEDAKKHYKHSILQLSKVESLGMKEALDEYIKLPKTKKTLEYLIGLYKLKYKESELKKKEITNLINNIKNQFIKQIDEDSIKLKTILSDLESQRNSVQDSILKTKELDQKLEYFTKLNKIDKNIENNIQEISINSPKLFIENYETDYLEFNLPFSGQFFDDFEIINHKIDIIPNNPSRLIVKYLNNYIYIVFSADINLPLNAPDYPKFNTFISFKGNKNEFEYISLSNRAFPQDMVQGRGEIGNKMQQLNSIVFELEQFMNLAGEEKKIRIKLYILKTYFK